MTGRRSNLWIRHPDGRLENVDDDDIVPWARWFDTTRDRYLERTQLGDGLYVSTVFLGIDHAFGGDEPILFETMVFRGGSATDDPQWRWRTEEEARRYHAIIVRRLRVAPDDPLDEVIEVEVHT